MLQVAARGQLPSELKPDLVVRPEDLTLTARDLAHLIAQSGEVFDRAGPVQLLKQADGGPPRVAPLDAYSTINLAHKLARPVVLHNDRARSPKTLPKLVANLYLACGEWGLRPLRGITTVPLLSADGSICVAEGYHVEMGLWCAGIPHLKVPNHPTLVDAHAALAIVRETFRTFPFADANVTELPGIPVRLVDTSMPPDVDESTFIAGLVTAICRSSLPLAPGLLIGAPLISGSGNGKGLLVGATCAIAYGMEPRKFTAGGNTVELDKRLSAALLEATQIVFLDNVNCATLNSELLASVLTERHVDVRPLGTSRMLPLCPNAFIAVTGNGLRLTEDLARRFVVVELDARMPDPEARKFQSGFLRNIAARRAELLTAALTIWRWGRQNESALTHGRPLGSYEEWCLWVRDPLLTLGCADPVARISLIKARDPMRRSIEEILQKWWECHGDKPVKAAELDEAVRSLIDPLGRGRQFVTSYLRQHTGTCVSGLQLTSQEAAGKWGAAAYALRRV